MSYKPGDTYFGPFYAYDPTTGALADASSPVGVVTHNGSDDQSVSVVVGRLGTGRYYVQFTIPTAYASGDTVWASVAFTVSPTGGGTVATGGVVGAFVLDGLRVSDLTPAPTAAAVAAQVAVVLGVPVIPTTTQGVSTSSTFTGDASLSAQDGTYAGKQVMINAPGSPGVHGAVATVSQYAGASRAFTLSPSWPYGVIPAPGTPVLIV